MFLYKWEEADVDEALQEDETITDYTYISEEHFLLFVLLTSKGDLRIYYDVPGTGPQHRFVSIRDVAPIWCHAAAVCLVPDASGLALVLTNGNVLLIPLHVLINIPWGHGGILNSDSFKLIEVEVKNQLCLKLPTSAVCYLSLYSKRPFLIYSNKAGQIFVIDLIIRKVSVGLGAPQSIHNIEILATDNSIYLLVTGFTGAQWIVPLEEEGLSIRETLSRIVPSELKQLPKVAARLSVTQDNKFCLLDMEKNRLQLFEDATFSKSLVDVNLPKNCWLVHWTDNAAFAVCEQTKVFVSVHCGISSFMDIVYEKFHELSPSNAILGIVPSVKGDLFPSCVIITDKGAGFVYPQGTLEYRLTKVASQHHFKLDFCTKLAKRMNRSQLEFCIKVIRHSLRCVTSCALPSDCLSEITRLATEVPGLELSVAVRTFLEFRVADLLLPAVLGRCDENNQDPSRHFVLKLFVAKFKRFPSEKEVIEEEIKRAFSSMLNERLDVLKESGKDGSVSEVMRFLLKHEDVSEGLEELLTCGFWSCIFLVIKRDERNAECVAKFLAEMKSTWPTFCVSDIVRILSSLSWLAVVSHAEQLLHRMTEYLPNLQSATHLFSFLKIAEEQMQNKSAAATILYVLSSLRLLAASSSVDREVLLSSTSLSCGSNCLSIVSEEELPVFWGEFTAGTRKAKDDEKLKDSNSVRLNKPKNLFVPCRVCSVACGTEHLLVLTFEGQVYSFGRNRYGQCGVGHKNELKEATIIPFMFGGVCCLKAGHYHSALVDKEGKVFTWGWGIHGQLGHCGIDRTDAILVPKLVETIKEPVVSVACGYAHTVFLTKSGTVLTCGNGNYGQLGNGRTERKRFTPGIVTIPEPVKLISSKFFHCLAITESQKLFQWGTSPQALKMKLFLQKRLRSNKTSVISPNSSLSEKSLESSQSHLSICSIGHTIVDNIVGLDAGSSHSALITEDGLLYTWGKGLEMQLGHGNKKEQEEPHQLLEPSVIWKDVSCGLDFTAALAFDGSVYVWGRNDKGQLGVTSDPSPSQTRKLVLKTQKGPKTVELSAGSCVSVPQKLASIASSFASEVAFSEVSIKQLFGRLRQLDINIIRDISNILIRDPVCSSAAIFVHLLAGDIKTAVKLFLKIRSTLFVDGFPPDYKLSQRLHSDCESDPLCELLWEFIVRHPNYGTQWELLDLFLSRFSMADRFLSNSKLSMQAPTVMVANPSALDGLDAMEKLRLIEKWNPTKMEDFVEVYQSDLQKLNGKVRVWTCCGKTEKVAPYRGSVAAEKRRVCSSCSEAWKEEVRLKFLKK